jgi:1-acyl-sn-glycerol-3-phosphate acyltransferase
MLYFLVKWFCRLVFAVYNRLRVEQRDRIPSGKPLLLACNHCSYLDPVVVGAVFPYRLSYVAWDDLFRRPVLKWLIPHLGAIPVSQEDHQSAAALLKFLLGLLAKGERVLIFPEGKRSPDGQLQPLEGGVALLALKTGIPVLPLFVTGTFEAMAPTMRIPRPRKIRLRYGELLDPTTLPSDIPERERRAQFLALLEQRFRSLEAEMKRAAKP